MMMLELFAIFGFFSSAALLCSVLLWGFVRLESSLLAFGLYSKKCPFRFFLLFGCIFAVGFREGG